MNTTKLFGFLAFSLLTLVVFGSALTSASTISFTTPTDLTLGQNSTTFTLRTDDVGNTAINPLSFVPSATITQGSASITLAVSPSNAFTINATSQRDVTVSIQSVVNTLPFGTYSLNLNATGTNSTGAQVSTSIPVQYLQSFCKAGARGGNLSIDKVDITSSGDKDEEWKLRDRVSVDVRVENLGSNNIRKVKVELGLFDAQGRNLVNDLDFTNSDEEKIDLGSINDGNDETATFEFSVPADMDLGDYKLAVKVYSDDAGETHECDDTSSELSNNYYESISIDSEDQEEKFVVVDEISMPEQAICGETVTGNFKVFNIGDEDQDQVLITMKNAELGLNKEFEIREDLNKGDDQTIDFAFDIPSTGKDGTYSIAFKTFYQFDNGRYRQESEDQFTSSLKVLGCKTQTAPPTDTLSINAELDSDAKAGKPLTVRATIRNKGKEEATIRIDADGYASWAELDSISRRTITLAAGDSATVDLTFNVNADVSSSESFTLKATTDNRVETQEVEVNFGNANTGSGFTFLQGSGLIWAIVIVNVILVALIVVVAVRLARR